MALTCTQLIAVPNMWTSYKALESIPHFWRPRATEFEPNDADLTSSPSGQAHCRFAVVTSAALGSKRGEFGLRVAGRGRS